MSKAKRIKGKKDYRDLTSEAQFYYEKLVQTLNDICFDSEIQENIECLDNLIDAIKEDMRNYYESKLNEINKLLDKANDWIDDLENKIEEF